MCEGEREGEYHWNLVMQYDVDHANKENKQIRKFGPGKQWECVEMEIIVFQH